VADATFSPLLDLLERFPDLFAQRVLQHLDPIDRTFLAQAGGACRAAVVASDLPRAGGPREDESGRSVWRVTHQISELCTSVERLAWAKASGCPFGVYVCSQAAGGGRLDVLQWAREKDCPWGTGTCASAARGGHLEVLKWAREHGCPWNGWTCAYAASGGHLEMLKWAREHGCNWDEVLPSGGSYGMYTCSYAASGGHLEVLQWAREHGCPWNREQCLAGAARYGHAEVARWVQEQ